jgi:acetyl esterase/lipase
MMTYPNLDPELVSVVAAIPPLDLTDLVAIREANDAAPEPGQASALYEGVDLQIVFAPGLNGAPDVPIRMMRPTGASGVLPVLLAMHGGGYVLGRAQDFDYFCLEAVRTLGIAVANVEYRLAPETPFPGPLDDCIAALRYVHQNAEALGVDPNRMAVGGSSAGGGLAAATVLRTRDEGGPHIVFQLLLSPALDDRGATPSASRADDMPVLSLRTGELVWQHYLGAGYKGPDDPTVSPYAAPARADDLAGIPPTYIAAMELDPVRDEGLHYAFRLLEAGVSVELHSHPGTFHGSAEFAPQAASSVRILRGMLDALGRGLSA